MSALIWLQHLRKRWARSGSLSPEIRERIVEQARFVLSYKSPRVALVEYLEKKRWAR